ncbi:MAG: acyl-CoA dehydrogenase C-terminal domain-containing protein, partial [Deltaproteobacteria bacterium]|nr:acyl-CoA dehydrogenase C-terminal domain-containing protein [Deltaproteobacteria bacterium]
FQNWLNQVTSFAEQHKEDADFSTDFDLLDQGVQVLARYLASFSAQLQEGGNVRLIPLNSNRFLDCFAEVVMGQLMLEQGLIAREKGREVDPGSADELFYKGKMETARFFCRNIMTNVFARETAMKTQDTSALDIPEEVF